MSIESIPLENTVGRSPTTSTNDVDKKKVDSLNIAVNKHDGDESTSKLSLKKDDTLEVKDQLINGLLVKNKLAQEKEEKEEKEPLFLEQSMVEVEQSIEAINQILPLRNTNLIFEFDDINDPPIVKVIDKNTDEVIREIPPKNIRDIAKALNDMADSLDKSGALFSSKV